MRIDPATAERSVQRTERRGRAPTLHDRHDLRPGTSSATLQRLVRALRDHHERFDDFTPLPRPRGGGSVRTIDPSRKAALVAGLSTVAGLGRLSTLRDPYATPFRIVREHWLGDLSEEAYRWPERDDPLSFFLYALYEDRGILGVGLVDATVLVIAPGLDEARVIETDCATCGRPVMGELTPWLPAADDPAFCCRACERRTLTPGEVWDIEQGLDAVWQKERKVREEVKRLHTHDLTDADWIGDYGRVLALPGVDALATVEAQLRAGPLLGVVMLVDGSAYLQAFERFGPSDWTRTAPARARAIIRRTPFGRRVQAPTAG